MNRGYGPRKIGLRAPYKLLVLVCEGDKTEPVYFNNFRNRDTPLKIIIRSSNITDAKKLVHFAKSQIQSYDVDFESGDRVWCVFDVDQNTKENLKSAINEAKQSGIDICLSNPCFEIWYLLHFQYTDSGTVVKDVCDTVSKYLSNYDKTKDYFKELNPKTSTAIQNAKKLLRKHESENVELLSRESNPSTHVFKIIEHIQDAERKKKKRHLF